MSWRVISLWFIVVSLWSCTSDTTQNAPEDELNDYYNPKALVEAEDLLISDSSRPCVLIDFRSAEEYLSGHIEGAIHIGKREVEDTSAEVSGMKLDKVSLEKLMRQKGVNKNEQIIIYDNKMCCDAARLWWVLRINGCDDVSLLNGGWSTFLKSGGKAVTNVTPRNVGDFTFVGRGLGLEAKRQLVESVLNREDWSVVDARSIEEHTGKQYSKNCKRLGCIPGSLPIDWSYAVDYHGDQKFKTVQELSGMYSAKGVKRDKNIVTYCRSGVRSAHTTFVLTELLGYPNVYNYDGSWLEWSSIENLPVELKNE